MTAMLEDLPLFQARAARDAGIALVDAAEPDWSERADRAVAYLAATGREFSSDDVRELVGDPAHANKMGPVFLRATRRGLIVRVGWVQSKRPSCHAHQNVSYRGAQA